MHKVQSADRKGEGIQNNLYSYFNDMMVKKQFIIFPPAQSLIGLQSLSFFGKWR